jgi:hypothetical protein
MKGLAEMRVPFFGFFISSRTDADKSMRFLMLGFGAFLA